MLEGRFSRKVQSSVQRSYDEGTEPARQIIEEKIAEIIRSPAESKDAKAQPIKTSKDPRVASRKVEILKAILHAGARPITACELTAALAFAYGLRGYDEQLTTGLRTKGGKSTQTELLAHLNAVETLDMDEKPILGSGWTYIRVVREGILESMHELLWRLPSGAPRKISTDEIITRLGLDTMPKKDASTLVTTAGGVLETMGLVKKLPQRPGSRDKSLLWVHSGYIETTPYNPKESTDYDILDSLFRLGRIPVDELARPFTISGYNYGSKWGRFDINTVKASIKRLHDEGWVQIDDSTARMHAAVSPHGRMLLEEQRWSDQVSTLTGEIPHLQEPTRQAILGISSTGLTKSEEQRLDTYLLAACTLRRQESGAGVASILPELVQNGLIKEASETAESYLRSIAHAGKRPWVRTSAKKLRRAYLQPMQEREKTNPYLAGISAWFEANVIVPLETGQDPQPTIGNPLKGQP
jgi:hypothetical protein